VNRQRHETDREPDTECQGHRTTLQRPQPQVAEQSVEWSRVPAVTQLLGLAGQLFQYLARHGGANFSKIGWALPRAAGYVALAAVSVVLFGPMSAAQSLTGGVLLGFAMLLVWWRFDWRNEAVWLLGLYALASVVSAFTLHEALKRQWSDEHRASRVIGTIHIVSLIEQREGAIEFLADVMIDRPARLAGETRLRVVWRDPPRPLPAAAERWQVMLRLKPLAETGGSAPRRVMYRALRDRIDGEASVVKWSATQRLSTASPGILRWRALTANRIADHVEDRDAVALFQGLAVGATGAITREQWRVFSVTGTTHLVAISGMHVTLFAWFTAALARILWLRLRWLNERVDREWFAGICGVPAAAAYAILAGFGIPTQRTVVMLLVWWLLRLSGRAHTGFEILALALLAVLVIDPFAPLSAGFWLSFLAMGVLLSLDSAAAQESGWRRWWAATVLLIRVQWRVSLALVPLTALWFSSISVAGVWVNLLAIPIFSFLLVPLVLLAMLLQSWHDDLAHFLWRLAEAVHEFIWPIMHYVASQPWAALTVSPTPLQLLHLSLVMLFLLWPIAWRWRLLCCLVGLPLWQASTSIPPGAAEVTVLNARDSFALIVATQRHLLVYDTGEYFGSNGRAAESLVVPAVRAQGRRRIDKLLLSVAQGQRAKGAARLSVALPVTATRFGGTWPGAPAGHQSCEQARAWIWDGVRFDSFAAPGGSCLLRVAVKGGDSLLVAERVTAAEARALTSSAEGSRLLPAEHLVVPRRGSPAAVTPAFVAAVGARSLIVSAADFDEARERRVMLRYGVPASAIHATARSGGLHLLLQPKARAVISPVG